MILTRFSIFIIFLTLSSCYRFQGISIDSDITTFNVERFKLQSPEAPANLNNDFTEALNEKIRNNTSLAYTDTDADIEFAGAIVSFTTSSEAPQPNQVTAFNRLEIRISVEYIDNKDETKNWKQTFSHFANYDSAENLANVQDGLVEEIFEEIVDNIFNKAFTNW